MGNLRKALERAAKPTAGSPSQRPVPGNDQPIVVSLEGVRSAPKTSPLNSSLETKRREETSAEETVIERTESNSTRITSVLESLDRAVQKESAAGQLDPLFGPPATGGQAGPPQHPPEETSDTPRANGGSVSPRRPREPEDPSSAPGRTGPRVFLDDIQPIRAFDEADTDSDVDAKPQTDDRKAKAAAAERARTGLESLPSEDPPPTTELLQADATSPATPAASEPQPTSSPTVDVRLDPKLPHVRTITTDEADVPDPVAAANAITGRYEPEDLDALVTPMVDPAPNPPPDKIHATHFEQSVIKTLRQKRIQSQYQQLWESMCHGVADHTPAVMSVVSTEPEVHVSRVLGHLGVLLSREMGKRVLLVDGDLRRRGLSSEFEATSQRGLSEACRLQCDWAEVVIPTSHKQLCVVPAGDPNMTAEELDELNLPTMVRAWKEMFDVILIDGGDTQASLCTPILKTSDRTYLLVRLGKTGREFADEVVQSLKDQGLQLDGCLVTNLP